MSHLMFWESHGVPEMAAVGARLTNLVRRYQREGETVIRTVDRLLVSPHESTPGLGKRGVAVLREARQGIIHAVR